MTSIVVHFTIAFLTISTIEGYPTPNPNPTLTDIEKEIVNIRQGVLPGLQVAAKQLKEKLPLSALDFSLANLYRMIDPLLAIIDLADTLNKTSVTFRVLEVLTEDTCEWLGLTTCQKEAITQIRQTLLLQTTIENQREYIEMEYLPNLCKQNRSLPPEYCNNPRSTEEWKQENMIIQ